MRRQSYVLGVWLLLTAGCAVFQPPPEPLSTAPLELTATPFFPQQDYLCGPAALATVLGASGRDVHPDDLIGALYIPERRGSLQVELMAAARRHGRLAIELPGGLPAIVEQLEAGRPVLVLQNLAIDFWPVWHYAVVIGYRPEPDQFLLRSGRERRKTLGRGRFAATWDRADRWALLVLDPDAAPRGVPPRAYLQAAADLENVGAYEPALRAFRAAVTAWPEEVMAGLGVANNLYYLGRHDAAMDAYRRLLASHPDHAVAVHNLAMLLLEAGRPCEAQALMRRADAEGPLLDTARRAVARAPVDDCAAAARP